MNSRKALIIGINDYPDYPLTGCLNDAEAIASILEKNENGSPNFTVKLSKDTETKTDLVSLIKKLFEGNNEIALLYFSGHGFLNELGGYIVTPDYKKGDEGIKMDDILIWANESKTKDKIIIFDCCHSGSFGSPALTRGASNINEGITVLTASKSDEPSIEIMGHGVFTSLLLNALQGGAADLRGHITPGSIYAYIDQALGTWDQRPVFKTNVTSFISLREVKPPVPLEILRKITEYFPSQAEEYQLDPSYEITNTNDTEHIIIEPFANSKNVAILKDLQEYESVNLVKPVEAKHMYFAAMNSKSCKLTALGYHYWHLVKEGKI